MILIKKYANRRLYDTSSSCYITLAECADLIRQNTELQVVEASTNEDITASVMIQIILELEQEKQILPLSALRQIICAYGSEAEILLTRYLEKTLSSFARHHNTLDKALEAGLDAIEKEQMPQLPTHSVPTDTASGDETMAMLRQLARDVQLINTRLNKLEH